MSGPDWRPEREVELVAGTPAGGGQDRPARVLLDIMRSHRLLEVPIRLTNIPGRGGGNAWDYLVQHQSDPHVIAIASPTLISNPLLGISSLRFSDLTPLAILYTESLLFVSRADGRLRTADELLADLRRPESLPIAFATAIGNMNHIALAKITAHAGGDVRALQLAVFDSARYAIAHVLQGKAELAVVTATSAAPELAARSLHPLAVSSSARLPRPLSDVPTWRECGVECALGMWRGVIGAPELSHAQVEFWSACLRAATRTEAWRAELAKHLWADTLMIGAQVPEFLEREEAAISEALMTIGLAKRQRASQLPSNTPSERLRQ